MLRLKKLILWVYLRQQFKAFLILSNFFFQLALLRLEVLSVLIFINIGFSCRQNGVAFFFITLYFLFLFLVTSCIDHYRKGILFLLFLFDLGYSSN